MQNADCDNIIEGRVVFLGNFNIHCQDRNVHCGEKRYVAGLERPVNTNDLILNNESGKPTLPTERRTTSIIDLLCINSDNGALDNWVIDK